MAWLCTCTRMPDGTCFLRDVMKRTARKLHTPWIHFYGEPNAVLDHTIFDHMILLPDRGQDSTQNTRPDTVVRTRITLVHVCNGCFLIGVCTAQYRTHDGLPHNISIYYRQPAATKYRER